MGQKHLQLLKFKMKGIRKLNKEVKKAINNCLRYGGTQSVNKCLAHRKIFKKVQKYGAFYKGM